MADAAGTSRSGTPPWGAPRWARSLAVAAALLVPSAALADPKDDARRHYTAGMEAARVQDFDGALQEFLLAQSLYSKPQTLFNIGLAYSRLSQPDDAVAYFEQALAAMPGLPGGSLVYVGAAYASAGRVDDALRVYRDARARSPELAERVDPIIAALESRQQQGGAVAVAPAGASGGSATAAELARLSEIAAELARISDDLSARGASDVAPSPEEIGAVEPAALPDGVPASGATDDPFFDDVYQRVVVTASRYGQDPMDSPSTVSILTADDIRMSGATNIPDMLRQVVGVDVMSLSSATPEVSIRGFNREMSNKVLVLVDGRSVYFDLLATPVWSTLPISLPDIERIEIIRGPGSAVYGANAMTGVINIITRTPGTGDNLVTVEAGDPGYGQGAVSLTGRTSQIAYRLSTGFHQTGRWSKEAEVGPDSPLELVLEDDNSAARVLKADGRIDTTFGDKGFASLSGGHAEGASEFYVFGALGDYAMDFRNSYVRGDLAWGPVHLRSFWSNLTAEAGPWQQYEGGRDLLVDAIGDVVDVELETSGDFETGAVAHRYALGVGYRYKRVSWGYLEGGGAPIDENHYNAFAQDQATIGPVNLVGSLRVDKHPLVDISKTISPRGAVVVRVAEQTTVRATGGTSFRAPSHMESYLDLDQKTPADGVFIETRGNRQLVPERTVTGELGVHDESSRFHRADLVGYVNRVSDLIYVQDVEALPPSYDPESNGFAAGFTQFGNLSPVYTGLGVELDTRFFPTDGLDVFANVNVQRIMEDDGGQSVRDGSTSQVKLNAGVAYRTPWRIDGSVATHYASAQTWRIRDFNDSGELVVTEEPVAARNIVVARLAGRPAPDERLELAVTAWNLGHLVTGEAFREHPDGQLVGSRLYGTATYRF